LKQFGNLPLEQYQNILSQVREGNNWEGEYQTSDSKGNTYWESARVSPVFDDSSKLCNFLVMREDKSLQKEQEELILHHAHYDALTELPNRFLALDRLQHLTDEAKRSRERAAVLFMDLDDFKKINDTLGHDTGDHLLINAAERLSNAIRAGDTVCRLGGDEFIVLLGGLKDPMDAQPVVDNLLSNFREAFTIEGRELLITSSIGIAIYPDDGTTPAELLRNADSAMYHSKEQGRNTYSYFTDSMNQKVTRRLQLEGQMHGALDRGEFSVSYQPQIEIKTNRVVGIEALLRWNNQVLGDVSPSEFIPIAEQTGIIIQLGQFVLTEGIQQYIEWQRLCDHKITLAVNMSPRQFRDPKLLEFIEQTLKQYGITGNSIELEITEGVLMSGHAYIDEAIYALSELGIGIAMDDFGTGYSSLSYLRQFPFDSLKIDRDFVCDLTTNPADQELVNATIAMAHGLGLKVVAEGVETKGQLSHLSAQNCDMAQGYLFSKPTTSAQIAEMLQH